MTHRPERLPQGLAVTKNAEAMELFRKGKLREALRALNEAIYSAPDYPHSYANRAQVFERLGMFPQAEGDRERARRLALSSGYAEEEVAAVSAPAAPVAPRRRSPVRKRPSTFAQRTRSRFAELPETVVLCFGLLGMAATVAGIFFAVSALRGSDVNLNVFDFESFQGGSEPDTGTAAPTAVPDTPTPPPVTPPPEVLAGTPFSFSTLQSAWQAKGITATPGSLSGAFTGFVAKPFDVRLTRGGDSAALSVLVYPNRDAPQADWNLSAGSRPSPKPGRSIPANDSIWWNTNVIVVARSAPGEIGRDALAAFLALGG